MIPLVLLDIDGTLIGSSAQVQACVWEAAARAREAGVRLAVCTGRPGFGVAARVAQRLDPDTPHIFQSGAQITYLDGNPLQVSAVKEERIQHLVRHARELGVVLELYTPQSMYVERRTEISEAHAKMIGVTPIVRDLAEVASREPIVRAQWVVASERLQDALAVRVEGIDRSVATSPALPDTFFVSLTRTGVGKGSAVQLLCERLELQPANVMAVGDSPGDLSMLERVGHPRVMANSDPELLERFPHHLGDVEECGAAQAFDEAIRLRARA